jgi:hypothetical protein
VKYLVLACLLLGAALAAAAPVVIVKHRLHAQIQKRILAHLDAVVFTPQTAFVLGGTACTYDQVPPGAVPTLIEFSPDGATVVKVHFRKLP